MQPFRCYGGASGLGALAGGSCVAMVVIVLGLVSAAWGDNTALRPDSGSARAPSAALGGGDTCACATVIGLLPFYDTGDTCDFVNDYDAVCPWSSTSPDVV